MANTYNVLDISKWNPIEDYNAAAAEIDGVIIKAAYRGYSSTGTLATDPLFEKHYAGFVNKTKIGVYFFTQAINRAEGIAEANYIYNLIKNKQIDMPVYIDTEWSNSNHNGRADSITAAARTEAVIGFCDRMIELGYRAGIYASDSWYISQLDFNQIKAKKYSLWVASYSYAPKRVTSYDGWQYTSSGSISGYSSRVDLSYFYNDIAGWDSTEKKQINDCEVTLDLNTVTYYGGINQPVPTVTYQGATLKKDTHYSVQYKDNINAGKGSVIITGINMYEGTKTVQFTIEARDINSAVSVDFGNSDKDGCYSINNISLSLGDTPLQEGTDYTKENIKESVSNGYKVTSVDFVGKGNYTGSRTESFNSEKIRTSIEDFTVEYNREYTFTGKPIYPGIVLKDKSGNSLSPNTDYSLSYKDNRNVTRQASIIITAKGNYTGTKTIYFTINQRNMKDCKMSCGSPDEQKCYNLNNLTITLDSYTLVKDKDYSLNIETVQENLKVTSMVEATGLTNFTGTLEGEYLTEIIDPRIDISTLEFSIDSNNYDYTGEEIKPTVKSSLILDTDYSVEYKNNINAGEATINIKAIGEKYRGSKEIKFIINALSISNANVTCGESDNNGCYDLNNLTIKVGKFTLTTNDYDLKSTITEENRFYNTTLNITGKGNFKDSITKTYRTGIVPITPKTMGELAVTVIPESYEYNGSERIPVVTVLDEQAEYELQTGKDYIIEYRDNINAGTAKIILTGNNETYSGTRIIEFAITQVDISSGILSCGQADSEGCYNLKNLTLSVNSKIVSPDYYDTKITSNEVGKYIESEVVVTGKINYKGTITNTFRSGKVSKDIADANIRLEYENIDYTGESLIPNIITELKENVDYTVERPENTISAGEYSFSFNGIGIYFGTLILRYRINHYSLTNKDIKVSFDDPDEFGCVLLSSMKVKRGDKDLNPFIDYTYTTKDKEIENGFISTTVIIKGLNNYSDEISTTIITAKKEIYRGREVNLNNVDVYIRYSSIDPVMQKTGTFYLWDDKVRNNRIRITTDYENLTICNNGFITGWINIEDLAPKGEIEKNDPVIVNGTMNTYADGSGNSIRKCDEVLYVVDIVDEEEFEYPYGLASAINRNRIGWAKKSDIRKYEP